MDLQLACRLDSNAPDVLALSLFSHLLVELQTTSIFSLFSLQKFSPIPMVHPSSRFGFGPWPGYGCSYALALDSRLDRLQKNIKSIKSESDSEQIFLKAISACDL